MLIFYVGWFKTLRLHFLFFLCKNHLKNAIRRIKSHFIFVVAIQDQLETQMLHGTQSLVEIAERATV